jgi:hypothetical protein
MKTPLAELKAELTRTIVDMYRQAAKKPLSEKSKGELQGYENVLAWIELQESKGK